MVRLALAGGPSRRRVQVTLQFTWLGFELVRLVGDGLDMAEKGFLYAGCDHRHPRLFVRGSLCNQG